MKKRIIAILSIIFLILGIMLSIYAADYAGGETSATGVLIMTDATEVNPGDTFTVTVSANCEDGINGLTGNLNYDANQLELVSAKAADTEKWSSLGQNSEGSVEIAIIANTADIKSGDIFKVTFKVKESVEIGTTIKVTPSDIVLDTLSETDSEYKANLSAIEIKVKGKEANKPNQTDNTTKENEIKYENIVEKNAAKSTAKTMPYTGTNMLTLMLVFGVGIISVILYVQYRRYKDI